MFRCLAGRTADRPKAADIFAETTTILAKYDTDSPPIIKEENILPLEGILFDPDRNAYEIAEQT